MKVLISIFSNNRHKIKAATFSHNNNKIMFRHKLSQQQQKYVPSQIFTTTTNIFPDKFSNRVHIFRCVEHVHECGEPSQVQLPHPGQGDQGQGDDDNGD